MSTRSSSMNAGNPALTLVAVCLAAVVLPIALTGVANVLPPIGEDLDGSLAGLQWAVNGYDLTFASLMLAAGSIADRLGRRRVFTFGVGLFSAMTLFCAVAWSMATLDIARALAGVGAAAVLTAGSALLAQSFDGAARARAFGFFGTTFGVGLAFGPLLAGVITDATSWRGLFLLLGLMMALPLLLLRALPGHDRPGGQPVDWPGTFTFSASLALLIWACVRGQEAGWASIPNVALYVASAAAMAGFVVAERRHSHPMFDLTLFAQRRFVAVCIVPVALAFGFVALLVILPTYFINVQHASVARTGLLMLVMTIPTLLLPVPTALATRRLSMRTLLEATLLLTAAGVVWLTMALEPSASLGDLAGPFLLIGAGFGMSLGILDVAAVSSVPAERAGMAAGMFNATRLAGEVVAIAVSASLVVSVLASRLASQAVAVAGDPSGVAGRVGQGQLGQLATTLPGGDGGAAFSAIADGYTDAVHIVLLVIASICVASALIIAPLLRDSRVVAPEAVAEVENEPADPGVGLLADPRVG